MFGSWLRGFTDLPVKLQFMEAIGEEARHSQLLAERIRELGGGDPADYDPVPGQIAMFNSFAGLQDTVERVAAFSLAGEAVADYLIELMLDAPGVPEWLKAPYRLIHEDEAEHGNYPGRGHRPAGHSRGKSAARSQGRRDEPGSTPPLLR